MKLTKISFENYRNLEGLTLYFDKDCNFLVGENGIGKTNVLYALKTIFSEGSFSKRDYERVFAPIIIDFTVKDETCKNKGKDYSFMQDEDDLCREFPSDLFSCVFLDESTVDNASSVSGGKTFEQISLIKHFCSGENDDYSSVYARALVNKIIAALQKSDSVLCLLDQPEKNLHPFAQRALMKDLSIIASGRDKAFNRIIARLFGKKKFDMQIIAVSHSDRILTENYRSIIRFYKENGTVQAVCGKKVKPFGEVELEKQLYMQFPYFSLAIFSRCVVLVEGVSEYGALTEFAKTLFGDPDYYGISIISANGEGNIFALAKILEEFKIKVFAVKDRDVYNYEQECIYTDFVDFEDEIVRHASCATLEKILGELGCGMEGITSAVLQKKNERYRYFSGKIKGEITPAEIKKSENLKKLAYLTVLSSKKSVITGIVIGKTLSEKEIPPVYRETLLGAYTYAFSNKLP